MLNEFAAMRIRAGLSLDETANLTGYSVRQLQRWEAGIGKPRDAAVKLLGSMGPNVPAGFSGRFNFIDLFAGIGGIRKGFDAIGGHCVFTSEWNKFAQETYAANFRDNHPPYGDITTIGTDEIPDHDVLLAGFPCQPFRSPAYRRRTRSAANTASLMKRRAHCSLTLPAS